MTAIAQNSPRLRPGSDHVESWFVRANDPHSPRAVWIKATVLTSGDRPARRPQPPAASHHDPRRADTDPGTAVAQAWCSVFDGKRTRAWCVDIPLATARFEAHALGQDIAVGPLSLLLHARGGSTAGELSDAEQTIAWDVGFTKVAGLGDPMSLLPTDRLLDSPVPSNKLVTPFPLLAVTGHLDWEGERWDLSGWHGMQGHNWGREHSPEYAWGQCVFTDARSGEPFAVAEAASGRTRMAGRTSALLSMLVVRRGGEEFRFDRIVDLWRQRPHLDFPDWSLRMSGRDGTAELRMHAEPEQMVCLAYRNPARATSYCLNSKTAAVSVHVAPRNGNAFELRSPHGGALEFLVPQPVDTVSPIV
ncbi:hypothetical protein [Nocardia sp. CDC153]|uniref:hypothetical protein n=1 Tax=Nocardia sp. CDC153 TaxID=3112167 RepID=UPI002DBC45A7|nr:hypothetical protein [Nocardia sp. CDC153]